MRIDRVQIAGYGRFHDVALDFAPGLQVVIGPNEQGKTTLRCFIGDMLYGQKRSATRALYDEAHQLRLPWDDPDRYGGTLAYCLDDGRAFEVARNFDKRAESTRVRDLVADRDVTDEFALLANRELNFAHAHLGIGKEVFLGTATISHFSLEDLGDRDALAEIRNKLATLADAGDDTHSADSCLRLLEAHIGAIGRADMRGRPLPEARERLARLQREYEQALLAQRQADDIAAARLEVLERAAAARARKARLEEDARLIGAHERAARLREAAAIQERIDGITQQVFGLGAARDFPLDKTPDLQRAETAANTARQALERTRAELRQLRSQAQGERHQLGATEPLPFQEVPEALESRHAELAAYLQSVRTRIGEIQQLVEAARVRVAEAQKTLGELPDFTRVASDPVEWFTQLASSFSVALRSRDEECALRARLRAEVAERRAALGDLEDLFGGIEHFNAVAREYELSKRQAKDQGVRAESQLHGLQTRADDARERFPGLVLLGVTCGAFVLVLLTTYFVTGNSALLIAAAATGLATAYFAGQLAVTRLQIKGLDREIAAARAAVAEIAAAPGDEIALIEDLLAQSGCQTLRELEAKHDQYREAHARLRASADVLAGQEERAREAEERIPQLLQRYRETFAQVGESIETEADVKEAAGRAIARYQDFRERKRRAHDSRMVWEKHQAELRRLQDAEAQCRERIVKVEEDIRRFMRERGFTDERHHDDLADAIKSYGKRVNRHREQRARVDVLEEKIIALETQAKREEAALERHDTALGALLAQAGVANARAWHAMAEKAREYEALWARRTAAEEQLQAVLRGEDLNALRRQVDADGPLPDPPAGGAESLRRDIEAAAAEIDGLTREAHGLQVRLAEHAAAGRALNEIEEDRAAAARLAGALQRELDATAYAMALIENIATDKHARIAPRLAAIASAHLGEITEGAYTELVLGRDLAVGVKIPGTGHLNEAPEKSLSKGTVDQIYFALRLALVEALGETGESIPMLLDDPFANYDDARLERTMRLLSRIGARCQVLLFTCREDVARAAEAVQAPILRLA